MGTGTRFFLFEDDGTMRRVSQKLNRALSERRETLPEYANQTLRYISVQLRTDQHGNPLKIDRFSARLAHFDDTGELFIDYSDVVNRPSPSEKQSRYESFGGTVVDLGNKFRRMKEARERWEPTPKEMTQITDFIWKPGAKLRKRRKHDYKSE